MHGTTAVGVFGSYGEAIRAVNALRADGFADNEIGIVARDNTDEAGRAHAGKAHSGLAHDPTHTRWEEGTGIGAAAGGATGLGLGLAVAAGLMPPLGPIIAGGALVALVASAGAGAAVGTVVGGLVGLGIPEEDATYYDTEFRTGRTLVTVQSGDRYDEALRTMQNYGAINQKSPAATGA